MCAGGASEVKPVPPSEPCVDVAHLSTRQYARIVGAWAGSMGLDLAAYGTHSLRRTKPMLI